MNGLFHLFYFRIVLLIVLLPVHGQPVDDRVNILKKCILLQSKKTQTLSSSRILAYRLVQYALKKLFSEFHANLYMN